MKLGVHSRTAGRIRRGRVASVHGFTIVETMIVLAVTGALFVAIAATLSGRQGAAEFTHAIQGIQSELQQAIDQVSAGFFPDYGLTCSNGGSTLTFTSGGEQGTNDPCVFLGKVIQFWVHGSGGAKSEQYRIYTIAGLRDAKADAGSPFHLALPTVVGVNGNYTSYSDARDLQYGLHTAWIRSDKNPTCNNKNCSIGAIAFLMEPGALNKDSISGYSSGAQQVDLIPIDTTGLDKSVPYTVSRIETDQKDLGGLRDQDLSTSAPINPVDGVQVCLASGTTNQSGLLTIGSSGRQLLVKLDIKNGQAC